MFCCYTLCTYQHTLCVVAVHYTCINTCYVLLLYTAHINTCPVLLLYTTHISIHTMYCCCTLHTYQYMLQYMYCCCTLHKSMHAMYCCCTLHTYQYVLLLNTPHISIHTMYCCCKQHTYQYMLCIVAIVYCTLVCTPYCPLQNNTTYHILLLLSTTPIYRASHSLLRGLSDIAQKNTTADIFVAGQL